MGFPGNMSPEAHTAGCTTPKSEVDLPRIFYNIGRTAARQLAGWGWAGYMFWRSKTGGVGGYQLE